MALSTCFCLTIASFRLSFEPKNDGARMMPAKNADSTREILQSIKAIPIEETSVLVEDEKVVSVNESWLHDAQQFATSTIDSHGTLIGQLYKLSKELAEESPEGIKNEGAMAFGAAFKDALDFGKHGGQIKLPLHLHKELPERLHKFLTDPDQ